MEAIIFDEQKKSLTYHKDWPMPTLVSDNDVIVRVAYSGVCGTDLHIIQGEFPALASRPYPLGHEFSGTVHEAGRDSKFSAGQRVVVDPNRACNLCAPCRKGKYQLCTTPHKCNLGVFADGGWAQYCRAQEDQVFLLPDTVTLEQGALCEPYSCVSHGYERASPLSVGDKILVVGAGIIGNLWLTILHHTGHRDVTVSELNNTRLDLVRNLETGFRLITPDILEKENQEYDVIIDCTGVGKVMEVSCNYLSAGGKYVVFGCSPPTHRASLAPFQIFDKELTIIGVKVNPFSFPTAIAWLSVMGSRYLDYKTLGVQTYKLSEYQKALDDLKAGSIAKAMLKID